MGKTRGGLSDMDDTAMTEPTEIPLDHEARDTELVARLREGDLDAMREAFDAYYATLVRFATSLLAAGQQPV